MKRIAASIGLIGLALLLSCGGGEEAKQNGILYANAVAEPGYDSLEAGAMLSADVMVDSSDLTLKVNGTELEIETGGPYPYFWFGGYVRKANPSELSFTSSALGNASASAKIPDSIAVDSPQDGDTLPTGQDVDVTWDSVACDFYWFSVDVYFYDTAGSYLDDREWYGYTTSLSYTIPKDSLIYPGMAYAEVDFEVNPVFGPVPAPGAKGNITGDLEGFFYGVGAGGVASFYVGTPVKLGKTRPHKPSDGKAFLKGVAEIVGR